MKAPVHRSLPRVERPRLLDRQVSDIQSGELAMKRKERTGNCGLVREDTDVEPLNRHAVPDQIATFASVSTTITMDSRKERTRQIRDRPPEQRVHTASLIINSPYVTCSAMQPPSTRKIVPHLRNVVTRCAMMMIVSSSLKPSIAPITDCSVSLSSALVASSKISTSACL